MSVLTVNNPYLDVFLQGGGKLRGEDDDYSFYDYKNSLAMFTLRDRCLLEFGYAIPNVEAIEALLMLSPLVEIGAGRGYWASLITEAGGEVHAYDSHVNADGWKPYSKDKDFGRVPLFHPVAHGNEHAAELHSSETLLLIWPPYDTSMATDCLRIHREHGGSRLAYIGEGWGGCTGNEEFHQDLEELYTHEKTIYLPQWNGMHDNLFIWELKNANTK